MSGTAAEQLRWQAVLERDASMDGRFVYAVSSTGVYCRPTCPSRRPRRDRVSFFAGPAEAESAGFRACRRCRPAQDRGPSGEAVVAACRFIERCGSRVPTLAEIAAHVKLSPFHLHRTFKRATGVTPRQYAEQLRSGRLRGELRRGVRVTDAIYEAGYGSGSRVYEKSDDELGMTPASYRKGGHGHAIHFGIVASPLGRMLVATTGRGVCCIRLADHDATLESALRSEFPQAQLERRDADVARFTEPLLAFLAGDGPWPRLPLDVRATAFQRRVWEALRRIQRGKTCSYSEIAEQIGRPTAVRAVARACAQNPVALAIPCHRVVRKDGSRGGFRWGEARKQKLLELEEESQD